MPEIDTSSPASSERTATGRGRRRHGRHRERDALNGTALAEEAFHLLRTVPLPHLLLYYLGTIPFVVAAYFLWADMSRSSFASRDAASGALGLTLLYLWMKGWQGLFCRRLWHRLHPSGCQVEIGPWRSLRYLAAQAPIQAFSLPSHLVSLLFIGWPLAFFQNATVLSFTQDYGSQPMRHIIYDAARYAHRNWVQNYLVLLLVLVLSFFVWINLLGAAILVPISLKTFLGIESIFTLSPESAILNTTFLFGTVLLSFLVIDPFLKSIYTLRCFRSQSRSSGADLISRIDRLEKQAQGSDKRGATSQSFRPAKPSLTSRIIIPGMLLLAGAAPTAAVGSGEDGAPRSKAPATTEALANAIEATLQEKEYQWRLPRQALDEEAADRGWLVTVMNDLTDSIERGLKSATQSIDDFFRKLFEGDRSSSRSSPMPDAAAAGQGIGTIAKVLFVMIVAGLLAWIIFRMVSESRRRQPASLEELAPAGSIDLESDQIVATQLPEDEWMKLAREQISKGEHRLAVRALFLASLSHLGERGLLGVARFKSNHDYRRELDLKARSLPEIRSAFGENVGLFERAWYGLHEIGRDAIDRFTSNYERITHQAPKPSDGKEDRP